MTINGFVYSVSTKVQFTEPEISALMKASHSHYDFQCRRQCEKGGIIYGLRNRLERDGAWAEPRANCVMTTTELDLLCKVVEQDGPVELYVSLVHAFRQANDEYIKLNPR